MIVREIDELGGRATADSLGAAWLKLDVREELAWIGTMARVLDSHGRLDVLVNNAGISGLEDAARSGTRHDPEHAALADWHAVMRTNLDGVSLGCKHALRALRRGTPAGSIINIASRSGRVGVPGRSRLCGQRGRRGEPHAQRGAVPFLPRGFLIPEDCLVLDYEVVMSSRERLWQQFGPGWGWPRVDMTLMQDLVDLGWPPEGVPAARRGATSRGEPLDRPHSRPHARCLGPTSGMNDTVRLFSDTVRVP